MIIVTGGAGFIGSNIVKGLNDRGYNDILIVDEMGSSEKFKNLIGLRYSDYCHKDTFIEALKAEKFSGIDVEAIFHQGACSDTMEYDADFMMSTNYKYSKTLLHYSVERCIPFLYASSASTYGAGLYGFREEEKCEGALNVYAFSKLAFDRYVRQILPQTKSLVVGLKYFNVFGPQEHHKGKMASIAYQFYNQIKNDGFIKLFRGTDGYGDGEQKRDFIYVKDVVNVNLWFFEHGDLKDNGVYNCGTGRARSFNDVAKSVISYSSKGHIEYIDFPEILKGKYQNFTEASVDKLLKAGYNSGFHTLESAVNEYCSILNDNGGYFSR